MRPAAHSRATVRHIFMAWRLDASGASIHVQTCATHLDDIAAEVAAQCQRKEGFHVLHRDMVEGKETLHVYRVKWSKVWRWCDKTQQTRQFDHPKAEHVAAIKVTNFVPELRWQWTPGADVVGAPVREIAQ